MKKKFLLFNTLGVLFFIALFFSHDIKADTGLYRLYHSGLQVHLFTTDSNEYKVLGTRGWKQEGIAWNTSDNNGDAVYRMYHPGLRVHLYTKDTNEYKVLAGRGWRQEGAAYRSYGSLPIYRLYHAGIKKHLYTKDANEYKVLASRGWKQEGVAFYGLASSDATSHTDPGNREILVSGYAIDSSRKLISNTKLSLEQSGKIVETVSVASDGYVYFHIEKNKTYVLKGVDFTTEIYAQAENEIQVKNSKGEFHLGRQTETSEGTVALQPSTAELTEVTTYEVNEAADQVILPLNRELQTGDDIILPPSEEYPSGYAFEVVSATSSNGQTIVQTKETSFDQLVRDVDIETNQVLEVEDFIPADGVQVLSSNNNSESVQRENTAIAHTGTINIKFSKNGISAEATLSGEIKAGMEYSVFDLQNTKIYISPSFSGKVKFAYSPKKEETKKEETKKVVVPLGVIPISLYNTLRVNAHVNMVVTAEGKVEIGISFESKLSGEIGLKNQKAYSSITSEFTTSLELTLSGEAASGISIDFKPGIAQIDLGTFDVGSYVGVEGEASVKLVSKNLKPPTVEWILGKLTLFAKITAGYEVEIGIGKIKAIDIEGRFTDKKLWEHEVSNSSFGSGSSTTSQTTTDPSTSTQPGGSATEVVTQEQTVNQGATVDPINSVANRDKLPSGMLYSWKETPDTSKPGTLRLILIATYPDGRKKEYPVTVIVTEVDDIAIPNKESDFVWEATYGGVAVKSYHGKRKNVNIPYTLGGEPVVEISDKAFEDNEVFAIDQDTGAVQVVAYTVIENIVIPSTVRNIGERAFMRNRLTLIAIPSSVTSIGHYAFAGNQLTSVTIPASVTYIGGGAFYDNELTSVTIPSSVTSIGESAFANNELTSVNIPSSLTNVRRLAFSYNQLTSVTIPDSITSIDEEAFLSNQLTSLIIPDSVITIGAGAFSHNQLTSVTIPVSVTSIGDLAFTGNQLTSVTIPPKVASIGLYAFHDNKLTSVTIPPSVTSIGEYAFSANQLTSVTLPSSVTSLHPNAFDPSVTISYLP
ncbi:TPA: leucine-rich repeat protein [Streptococcus suis]|nr:leucine-rich repeat protein [Streptococcus suis]